MLVLGHCRTVLLKQVECAVTHGYSLSVAQFGKTTPVTHSTSRIGVLTDPTSPSTNFLMPGPSKVAARVPILKS